MTQDPWTSRVPEAAGRSLVLVPHPVLVALADGDLAAASALSGLPLTAYLVGEECRGTWRRRRDQVADQPADAPWVTRLVVDAGVVVGRAGFHGRPDAGGTVEVGYATDPAHRRRGHARAALLVLLEVAAAMPGVGAVRASVRPDNVASRALLDAHGFVHVGEQWDEEDGRELVLERPARAV
ncbi:MAG: GNAT family protein [Nocardioidaceae bacterium]|nr:GNAT family protein [Nocardioidaceae bacterium]